MGKTTLLESSQYASNFKYTSASSEMLFRTVDIHHFTMGFGGWIYGKAVDYGVGIHISEELYNMYEVGDIRRTMISPDADGFNYLVKYPKEGWNLWEKEEDGRI